MKKSMQVVLRKDGNQIYRKFVESTLGPFWDALSLNSSKLPDDRKAVFEELKSKKDKVFLEFVDVPWYFDEVGRHVLESRSKSGGRCTLRVKACDDYHFIQLSEENGTLIGTPFFHRHRPAKEASGSAAVPMTVPELRGHGDLLLFLSTKLADADDAHEAAELLSWVYLELAIKIVSRKSDDEQTIEVTPDLLWPGPTTAHPWTSTGDPDKYVVKYAPTSKPILVASPNVRKAVSGVAEVWHTASVGSVLLSAWTGSGKDLLQQLLMHGLRQPDNIPKFSAPSLSKTHEKSAVEQITEKLVECKLTTGTWARKAGRLKQRTVVFVDEIHHPSAQSVREALLRPMETSELHHANKTYDCKGRLTFLFAASEPPDKLRKQNPVDFWTRIEHTVQMFHPLALPTQDERTLALEQYFGLFWAMALKDGAATNDPFTLLKHAECTSIIGRRFAELLNSPFIPIISMRMLRSVVKRTANRAVYALKTQAIEFDNRATIEAERAQSLGKAITEKLVEQWVKELFDEIVPSVQPEGAF